MRLLVFCLSRVLRSCISSANIPASPHRAQEPIPECEKRLAEVGLDTPALVMNVMVLSVVASNVLERIKGQSVTTVIINSLDCAAGEEPHALANGHAYYQVRDTST